MWQPRAKRPAAHRSRRSLQRIAAGLEVIARAIVLRSGKTRPPTWALVTAVGDGCEDEGARTSGDASQPWIASQAQLRASACSQRSPAVTPPPPRGGGGDLHGDRRRLAEGRRQARRASGPEVRFAA